MTVMLDDRRLAEFKLCQRAHGLKPDGVLGPQTWDAWRPALGPFDFDVPPPGTPPPYLAIARGELERGVREIPGPQHNERILEYLSTTTLGKWAANRDETAWCSAFINWCMLQAGLEGTNSAAARSWLGWGARIAGPRVGAVVVFPRGSDPRFGHVALVDAFDEVTLQCLGGNQGNRVSIRPEPIQRALGFFVPAEAAA